MNSWRGGTATSALGQLFVAIVIIGSNLDPRFWVLRKRAPSYIGLDLRVCVENSGVSGISERRNRLCRKE